MSCQVPNQLWGKTRKTIVGKPQNACWQFYVEVPLGFAQLSNSPLRQSFASALLQRPIGMPPFTGSRLGPRELVCDRFKCAYPDQRARQRR